VHYVIVPGIDDSDAAHWQSIWQVAWGPGASRIRVRSWSKPDLEDWQRAISQAVSEVEGDPVLLVA
jgi:uncharacterized protein